MINKDIIMNYAKLISSMRNNKDYQLTATDKVIIKYISDLTKSNPNYSDLTDKIIEANGDETKIRSIVDSLSTEDKQEEEKSEEEQISDVFDVPINDIQHLFLNSGKEVFYFYSESLGRDVVLENSENGKSLSDILVDLKNNTDDNEAIDSKGELVDNSLKNNLEMDLYSPNEVMNNDNIFASLNDDELELLEYLVKNAVELNIQLINVENLFYITTDHKIKEITFDKNFKPVISEPGYESNIENNSISQESNENSNENKSEIDDMFSDSMEYGKEKREENEMDLEKSGKKKVMKIDDYQENGFANNKFFIFSAILIIIIAVIVFALFYFVLR